MKFSNRLFFTMIAVLMLFASTFAAQAATSGWQKDSRGTYYLYTDGTKAQGLTEIKGDLYLFKNYYVYSGWQFGESGEPLRYFNPWADGAAAKGWVQESEGKWRYFDKKTCICKRGWVNTNGNYRYFSKTSALMAMGFVKNSSGQYRYFSKSNGVMATGWIKNSAGEYRYFHKKSGIMYVGWAETEKGRYYFKPNGVAYVNTVATIGGRPYKFGKDGIAHAMEPDV